MRRLSLMVLVAVLAVPFITGGCATAKIGKEKVVEKSDKRPKWAYERPMFIKHGDIYAAGSLTDAPNLGKGLQVAVKLAQSKIVESINLRLKDDFTYASEGLDVSATMVEHILNSTTEEITVHGFFQKENYYEKKEIMTPHGYTYRYDCFALVELSGDDYDAAINNSINRYLKGTVSEEFRKKVDERQRIFFNLDEEKQPKANEESSKQ